MKYVTVSAFFSWNTKCVCSNHPCHCTRVAVDAAYGAQAHEVLYPSVAYQAQAALLFVPSILVPSTGKSWDVAAYTILSSFHLSSLVVGFGGLAHIL